MSPCRFRGGRDSKGVFVEWSTSISKILPALISAMREMENPKKDHVNPHFKSKYANLEGVLAAKAPLLKNGIVTLQDYDNSGPQPVLVTTLLHESGEWIRSEWPLIADKVTPQGMGSAQTYARRYALLGLLDLVAEDDDGNQASGVSKKAEPKAPAPTKEKTGVINPKQRALMWGKAQECGWSETQLRTMIKARYGVESTKDIKWQVFDGLLQILERGPKAEGLA